MFVFRWGLMAIQFAIRFGRYGLQYKKSMNQLFERLCKDHDEETAQQLVANLDAAFEDILNKTKAEGLMR